jgi:hypothetical protein
MTTSVTDDYEYTSEKLKSMSKESQIVAEELELFFKRCRERINELPNFSGTDAGTCSNINESIMKVLTFRFGSPVAKSMVMLPREANSWNIYVQHHFKEKSEALSEISLGTYFLCFIIS